MKQHLATGFPFLFWSAIFVAAGGCGPSEPEPAPSIGTESPAPAQGPTNVVFIVIDTIRADRMSFLGYGRKTTPNLDELAKRSHVFERAYTTAPWTIPAIGSMFTGQHPRVLGITDDAVAIPEDVTTLPELFDANGYNTVGVVSHIYVGEKYGFARGFDYFDAHEAKGRNHISSPGVTRRAVAALEELGERDDPFFLFVHYFDPHYNYFEHEGFTYSQDYEGPFHSGLSYKQMRGMFAKGAADGDDRRYLSDVYDSEIAFTDHHIGVFLNHLENFDLYDETLIVLAGDHGEELADYADGWIGHTKRLTNELIHVPLLIKLPRQRAEKRTRAPVSTVDVMPTIAARAGLDGVQRNKIYGRPLALEGKRRGPKLPVVSETRRWARMQAVVTKDWKLVRDEKRRSLGLYHLKSDPAAVRDVSGEQSDRTAKLKDFLGIWRRVNRGIEAEAPKKKASKPRLTPQELEQLRELGYISDDETD